MNSSTLGVVIDHILYPKAIVLLVLALILFIWAGLFCLLLNKRYGIKKAISYVYYITYTLSLSIWVLSNAYFHTSYLVEFGEGVAMSMAITANISTLLAFGSAYQFTAKLRLYYIHSKPPMIQRIMAIGTFCTCLIWNLSPGLTIQSVTIYGPSQFILNFGNYIELFFLGLMIFVGLTFANLFSIRGTASRIRRARINYMILSMATLICSTAVIQLGFTYFFKDFSFTWLPPVLSISEMIVMGYAILAPRLYSLRYVSTVAITAILMGVGYSSILLVIDHYFSLTAIFLFFLTLFIGMTWLPLYRRVKMVANYLVYDSLLSPAEKILLLAEQFQHSPNQAMTRLANYLGVPSNKLRLLDDEQGAITYRHHFETHTTPLVIDELEDELRQTTTTELHDLHNHMRETNYALVLPLYEAKNKLSHILVSSHKPNGYNFSFEELMAMSKVLKSAQVHINYDQKLRQTQALANSIAHEMRNPLGQIQLEFENLKRTLRDQSYPKELHKHVSQGFSAIIRGKQLIDIILREVNHSSLDQEPVKPISMKSAIYNAVNLYGFNSNDVTNKVVIMINHDFIAKINETLFNFVMFNLLRNAIYYFDSYPQSKIEISTKNNDYENIITVRDYGPGIPKELLKRIFDDFFSHNKSGGSGLGLGYCQRVMKSFGGTIRCQSIYGEYTEFTLSFPLNNSALNPIESDSSQVSITQPFIGKNNKAKLILVVDDQEVQRSLVKLYLEQLGYDVVLANNGKVAIEIIHNNPIDTIFMDIQMPIMGGFEAAGIIKQVYPSIPIIALSGESGQQDIQRMNDLMDGRLSKPTSKNALSNVLNHVLPTQELI